MSTFDVDLKSFVAVENDGLRMVLPGPGEILPADNLSTVKFSLRSVPRVTSEEEELVEVPSFFMLSEETAESLAQKSRLKIGTRARQPSSYAQGTIIGQSPDPGDQVPAETPVNLTIASTHKTKVPSLIGMMQQEAEVTLGKSALTLGSVTEQDSAKEAGTVIVQDPLPEVLVDLGTVVNLVIARGTAVKVKLPSLLGLKEPDASNVLRREGLSTGTVTRRPVAHDPGTVIEQSPSAGTLVPPGTAVDLVIGVQELIKVPAVTKLEVVAAEKRIKLAGLTVGLVTPKSHPLLDGIVLQQEPAAGTEVAPLTPVNLVVARRQTIPGILGQMSANEDFKRSGISLTDLTQRLLDLRITTPEQFEEYLSRPEVQIVSDLGLRNVRAVQLLKRLFKEVRVG